MYEAPVDLKEVCLEADMSKITLQTEPVPARLVQGLPSKSKKLIDSIDAHEMAIKRKIQRITYPSEIRVHRTAQNFSRLAQPEPMVNISKINVRFTVQKDPTNSIGITKYGGIIFVRNNLNLFNSPAEIFS